MDITCIWNYENNQWFTTTNSENTSLIDNAMNLKSLYTNDNEIINDFENVEGNRITIENNVSQFGKDIKKFSYNKITFNSELLNSYMSILLYTRDIESDINIDNNVFNLDTSAKNQLRFINVTKCFMNNYSIHFSNNVISEKNVDEGSKRFTIFFQNVKDVVPQYVYSYNNDLGSFSNNIGKYNNQTTFEVIDKNKN